jgi:hypothetical protein
MGRVDLVGLVVVPVFFSASFFLQKLKASRLFFSFFRRGRQPRNPKSLSQIRALVPCVMSSTPESDPVLSAACGECGAELLTELQQLLALEAGETSAVQARPEGARSGSAANSSVLRADEEVVQREVW